MAGLPDMASRSEAAEDILKKEVVRSFQHAALARAPLPGYEKPRFPKNKFDLGAAQSSAPARAAGGKEAADEETKAKGGRKKMLTIPAPTGTALCGVMRLCAGAFNRIRTPPPVGETAEAALKVFLEDNAAKTHNTLKHLHELSLAMRPIFKDIPGIRDNPHGYEEDLAGIFMTMVKDKNMMTATRKKLVMGLIFDFLRALAWQAAAAACNQNVKGSGTSEATDRPFTLSGRVFGAAVAAMEASAVSMRSFLIDLKPLYMKKQGNMKVPKFPKATKKARASDAKKPASDAEADEEEDDEKPAKRSRSATPAKKAVEASDGKKKPTKAAADKKADKKSDKKADKKSDKKADKKADKKSDKKADKKTAKKKPADNTGEVEIDDE